MPAMPRSSALARKIVYAILGKPENMKPKTERQKRIDKTLVFQASSRMK